MSMQATSSREVLLHKPVWDFAQGAVEQVVLVKKEVQPYLRSSVYCVVEGVLRVETVSVSDGKRLLYFINPGEYFGFDHFFDLKEIQPVRVIAHKEARVVSRTKREVQQLIKKSPDFVSHVLRQLHDRTKFFEKATASRFECGTYQQVTNALHYLAKQSFASKEPDGVVFTVTKGDIRDLASTRYPQVKKIMDQLEDEGVIERYGKTVKLLRQ